MITRSTVSQYSSMREAYAAILELETLYLKNNKRKHTIDLVLSSTSKPVYDERGKLRLSKETIEVRAVYDNSIPAQLEEYNWFIKNIAPVT